MNTLHHLPVQAGFVFISIFAGLTIISLLTHFIARRYEMQPNAAVREFQTRISSWWVMTIVLLLAFWFGEIGATLLFFAAAATTTSSPRVFIFCCRCNIISC